MLLAIDVGNTNVTIGVFDGDRLTHNWRLAALRERTADELGIFATRLFEQVGVDATTLRGIALASVVPPLTRPMEEMCERYFGRAPLLVTAANAGIPVRYSPPTDVGADRIVNAVAAWELYGRDNNLPIIIVDFGTGTTFDIISRGREYLGGIICPGLVISMEALFARAARLLPVDLREPQQLIGTNSTASMQSGFYYGALGTIDGILERLIGMLGPNTTAIATGGQADMIAKGSRYIKAVDPGITLTGLQLIWDRSR